MKVLKSKEMAFADENTINLTGIPSLVLMENAGRTTAEIILNKYKDKENFVIIAGSGNNGGDALVVARYLYKAGKNIKVYVLSSSREKLSKDNLKNLEILETFGVDVLLISEKNTGKLRNSIKNSDIIVEGIFGTGFKPPVKGYRERVINLINQSGKNVVSIDIPSGLWSDSGNIEGEFIRADLTITYAYPKLCHILYPASEYCGEVYVVDISIDENYLKEVKRFVIEAGNIILPERKKNSHKYNYGHNLIIGGSTGKSGAVIMAAKASTKAGAGLTTTVVPECINQIVETNLIEEMSIPVDSHDGIFGKKSINQLKSIIKKGKFSSITAGMGMSVNENTIALMEYILKLKMPAVIDADGLNNIALIDNFKQVLKKRKYPTILTPHVGEMSRLTGIETSYINKNMEEIATSFAEETNSFVVLKSSRIVIASPEGKVYYSIKGNEGMATAGTGDVLSGILGALINRLPVLEAVKTGVYLHGLSGDLSAEKYGVESLKATDLIEFIPLSYKYIEKEKKEVSFSLFKRLL